MILLQLSRGNVHFLGQNMLFYCNLGLIMIIEVLISTNFRFKVPYYYNNSVFCS